MTQAFESLRPPRRFYAGVDVAPAEGGFAVRLDGKTARSPRASPLAAPTEALARLIADEWAAQGERIVITTMPATRLAHTALDAMAAGREGAVASFAGFAADDLLCYFAEAPASLRARQEAVWGPLLDWAREGLGLRFERAQGVVHRDQPPATLERVGALAAALDDFRLAGLVLAAQIFGSAILAVALERGRLSGAEAFAASRIDEDFQARQWGEDAEAAALARALEVEARMLQAWFAALG